MRRRIGGEVARAQVEWGQRSIETTGDHHSTTFNGKKKYKYMDTFQIKQFFDHKKKFTVQRP